jgi:hypothetical protein
MIGTSIPSDKNTNLHINNIITHHSILVQICRVFKVIQEIYYEQTIFFRQIIQVSGLFKNKKSLYIYLTINYYCFHFCIYHDQTIDNPMEESLNFLLLFASVSSRLPYINFAEYHNGTKLHILTVSITKIYNEKMSECIHNLQLDKMSKCIHNLQW